MPCEVRIHVDVDATGHYVFRMRSGRREITTSVDPDLAASFYEDLRLLRWKSVGVHDPGDLLLNHVGDRLAALIAPPATWEELQLPDSALRVRVNFTQAAHRLMPFPWELLRVNDRFLIGPRGSHVVRDVPALGGTRRRTGRTQRRAHQPRHGQRLAVRRRTVHAPRNDSPRASRSSFSSIHHQDTSRQ